LADTNDTSPADPTPHLRRDLGLLQVTMIGIGAMIGAGVFVLIGAAAGQAGPAVILALALNGVIALIVGAHYAELSAAMPRAGGPYYWLKESFGPGWGFLAGWLSWFANVCACALYALAFGSFLADLTRVAVGVSALDAAQLATPFAIGITLVFLWVNVRGVRDAGWTETALTGLKVSILVVFVAFGLGAVWGRADLAAAYTPFLPEHAASLFGAMGLIFIAFEGYEIITRSAEEVRQPEKTIPRAIFLSIGVSVTLYVAIAFVLFGGIATPTGESVSTYLGRLGELGMAEAAGQLMPYVRVALLVAGLASTASALNATVYAAARISFAMGRGGELPGELARLHPRHLTPHWATWVTGALIVIMVLTLPVHEVGASASLMFLLVFVLVCASVAWLRRTEPELPRPFRAPGVPYLSWVGVGSGVGLAVALLDLTPVAWATAGCWLVLGLVVYHLPASMRR